MGGRHGSAHYHTATLQMASITLGVCWAGRGGLLEARWAALVPLPSIRLRDTVVTYILARVIHHVEAGRGGGGAEEGWLKWTNLTSWLFFFGGGLSTACCLSAVVLLLDGGGGLTCKQCACKLPCRLVWHFKGLGVPLPPALWHCFPSTNWLGGTRQ